MQLLSANTTIFEKKITLESMKNYQLMHRTVYVAEETCLLLYDFEL
jgi:hypothetical protein